MKDDLLADGALFYPRDEKVSSVQRVLNLMVALRNLPNDYYQGMPKSAIVRRVPGYIKDKAPDSQTVERKLQRDLDSLRHLGLEVVSRKSEDSSQALLYSIAPTHTMPAFTPEERMVLSQAARLWQEQSHPFAVSAPQAAASRPTDDGIIVEEDGAVPVYSNVALNIGLAIYRNHQIQIDYGSTKSRIIDPWHLFIYNSVWYLVGFDYLREAARTFRLSRMGTVKVLESQSATHGSDSQAVFSWGSTDVAFAQIEGEDIDQWTYGRLDSDQIPAQVARMSAAAPQRIALEPQFVAADVRDNLEDFIDRWHDAGDFIDKTAASFTPARPARPRVSKVENTARYIDLMTYVKAHGGKATIGELALHLDIDQKAVKKAVSELMMVGHGHRDPTQSIDIFYDEDEDVVCLGDDQEAALDGDLTAVQALPLLIALKIMEPYASASVREHLLHAAAKLCSAVDIEPDAFFVSIRARSGAASYKPGRQMEVAEIVDLLREAIATDRSLSMEYETQADQRSQRKVDPLTIVRRGTEVSLRAWCHKRQKFRTFSIDRIINPVILNSHRQVTSLEEQPSEPEVSVIATIDGNNLWVFDMVEPDLVVRSATDKATALLRFYTRELFIRFLLSYGAAITALHCPPDEPATPEALRDDILEAVQRAREAIDMYDSLDIEDVVQRCRKQIG